MTEPAHQDPRRDDPRDAWDLVFEQLGRRRLFRLALGLLALLYASAIYAPENASAERLLQLSQGHWGIENGLHYRRDTTLREDQTRMSQPQQAEVVAVLNNFVVGLARKLGLHNLASAQRRFDAAIGAALSIYL